MACRDCCGHWQMYFDAFVTVIPKIDFSMFVVFSAAVVLLVYRPPIRKCVVLYTLPVGLLRALISSLLVPPVHSQQHISVERLEEQKGSLDRRKSRSQPLKVNLRWRMCIPAVSPRAQQDRQNLSNRSQRSSCSWHAVVCSDMSRAVAQEGWHPVSKKKRDPQMP
jgi:hypothetical protein